MKKYSFLYLVCLFLMSCASKNEPNFIASNEEDETSSIPELVYKNTHYLNNDTTFNCIQSEYSLIKEVVENVHTVGVFDTIMNYSNTNNAIKYYITAAGKRMLMEAEITSSIDCLQGIDQIGDSYASIFENVIAFSTDQQKGESLIKVCDEEGMIFCHYYFTDGLLSKLFCFSHID